MKKNNSLSNRKKYKKVRKDMEDLINERKDTYYKKLINQSSTSMKSRWNAIRTIINRKKVEQTTCCIQNKILGKHYSTVAENLAKNLPNISNDDIPSTSKNNHSKRHNNLKNIHNDFCFRRIDEREVYENILKLDGNKGPGIDNFDVKILKSIHNRRYNFLPLMYFI